MYVNRTSSDVEMMPTFTVENYVKAIYQLSSSDSASSVATGELAKQLGISAGSVSGMVKTLAESGLVVHKQYEGVRLTEAGERLALRVIRRHRLIEAFLVRTLGLNWDEIHEEAENLEHAVSDSLIERIDLYLGRPTRDPHGDPIPNSDGSMEAVACRALSDCPAGKRFRVERVIDQAGEFLRFLDGVGLRIGVEGRVVEHRRMAGTALVKLEQGELITLGREACDKLRVQIFDE
jgi:DtxR family Mn-dependent transcriptional regulator